MNEEKRDTVGKISLELLNQEAPTRDPIELEREMHKDYDKNLFEQVQDGIKRYTGDFYIVVITKKERLMENVIRHYFTNRISCPTPDWDQTVYGYNRQGDILSFMWVVPARDICRHFYDNALMIAPEERWLLDFVLKFYSGDLLRLAKKLNCEQDDSPLLVS